MTPVDRVLARLPDATQTARGWQARCPAHEDGTASLSISEGDDGKVLVHCHAGCTIDAVVAALGLTMADLMAPKAVNNMKRTIAAVYGYRDEHGAHLFDVVRFTPKDFRQRRPDGRGGWTWNVKDVRLVPYRLPDLAGVLSAFVVEGEKDADALAALGLPATCNAGGAGKWRPEFSATLKTIGISSVCILPDHDAPGQAHAEDVARHCHPLGIEARVLVLPGLPNKGDVSDWLAAGGTRDALLALAKTAPIWTPTTTAASSLPTIGSEDRADPEDDEDGEPNRPRRSQAADLVDLALGGDIELWHTASGDAYATIALDGRREHHPLRRVVRDYLARAYYLEHKRVASSAALTDAANTLGGIARYDGPEHVVAVRLASHDGALYLDLGDPAWRMVEITGSGWRIVTEAPVRHWRPASLRALPDPVPGGSLDALQALWPVADDTWTLLVSWLVAAMQPTGPYPVLVLAGEQGTGKSTLGRMMRGILDPASPELRGVPRNEHDAMLGALTSYVVAFDNLSGLPAWLSDALCRIATGGGMATRTLYSDTDETLIDVTRPILLTGIDSPATRGDLLDRALVVNLPVMADEARGDEGDLWRRYHAMRPALLGALLDAAVCALRRRPDVTLPKRPRMADACLWVTAAEPALGWTEGRAATAWLGARDNASADLLSGDSVAQAVLKLALPWEGTSTDLLTLLTTTVSDHTRTARGWPTSARGLSGILRRLAPDLRRAGVHVDADAREGHTGRRLFRIVTTVTTVTRPANIGRSGDRAGDGRADVSPDRHPTVTHDSGDSGLFSADGDAGDGGDGSAHSLSAMTGGRRVAI